ncbi:MAG: hypothetical protein E3J21_06620 [Anaerolineales bacterium]|nr:MAG: hypothetical protein E3J21_06620 [Anaerolineales bacterium]
MKNTDCTDDQVTKWTHRYDKYLLLSWKRVLIIAGAWVLSVVLHNVVYGLFYEYFRRTGGDEAVFFILAIFVIPLYFIISLMYTVIRKLSKLVRNRTG